MKGLVMLLLLIAGVALLVCLPALIGFMVGGDQTTAWATSVASIAVGYVWTLFARHPK